MFGCMGVYLSCSLGLTAPRWIVFLKGGLTICEVPGEGDGPFAAEHPPGLGRETRKSGIYQPENSFMIALTIYLTA